MLKDKLKQNVEKTRAILARLFDVRYRRSALTFLVFLVISFVLWLSMTLNGVVQRDVSCSVNIINVPDSVTFISEPPHEIIVNVRARGTQLLKYEFGSKPVIDIDYRYFHRGNMLSVPRVELRGIAQNAIGIDRTIDAMSPDTIGMVFTTLEPATLPVTVDAVVGTAPNCIQLKPASALTDSVRVYSVKPLSDRIETVHTEQLKFYDVDKSFVSRVRLVPPSGCRVIPDSIDIRVEVEPVLSRSKIVDIETINVPSRYSLQLLPRTVRVDYLVLASDPTNEPEVRVVADFQTLPTDFSSDKIRIRQATPSPDVYLSVDSVEYLIQLNE